MRVPLGWLREYIDLPADVETVVAKLAALGFPVETIETRPHVSGVVVGTIVRIEKHPNADRLQVCTLDIGAPATLTIATAATNVAQGQIVPVATIGARLPELTIEPRKMRGVASEGMLCSAGELALPPDWFEDGIMQLDAAVANGTDVVGWLGLDLPVLDVEIGANRADALSIVGIARELGAALGAQLKFPPTRSSDAGTLPIASDDVRITLESRDVRRYIAQRVSGVRVRPAPAAMRVRLALAGQRPISNLVDISNYVMLELGQPLHFFDGAKIGGNQIIVRDARAGERLTTLDGIERELDPSALVIADERQATGLAGLMGGLVSEVSSDTSEILIESANFVGPRIRRMSAKLGLRTEASTRNEKNLAAGLSDVAAARAAYLLEREGAVVHAPHAYGEAVNAPTVIELRQRDVRRLLGIEVPASEMRRALEALGFGVDPDPSDPGRMRVTVPPWRADVTIAPDLVEEIARIVGYDSVRAELPAIVPQTLDSAAYDREMAIANALAGFGYAECLTLSLQPRAVAECWRSFGLTVPPIVEIRNPLSEDQRWMRFSLLPALLEHAARERGTRPARTFEIGHVFADAADAPRETNVVTLLAVTKPPPNQPAWQDQAFLAVSSDVRALVRVVTGLDARLERTTEPGLHPGKTARIVAGDRAVGVVGTVDPRLLHAADIADNAVAAILFIDALPQAQTRRYRQAAKYPAVERDLAIIVDLEISAAAIDETIRSASPLTRDITVFDEYRGPQIGARKKSLAVRVVLQRDDATLTDAQTEAAVAQIVEALRSRHGATLRG